jgi:hypothetical protein
MQIQKQKLIFGTKQNKNGSTFSYYMWKCMNPNVITIYIDLDKVHNTEVIVNGKL